LYFDISSEDRISSVFKNSSIESVAAVLEDVLIEGGGCKRRPVHESEGLIGRQG
jgi:hypothetical protein